VSKTSWPALAAIALIAVGCGGPAKHPSAASTGTNPTGMTSSTPTGLAIPAKVAPIQAVATDRRRTSYEIHPLDHSLRVTYAWSISPATCNHLTGQGSKITWHHGNADRCTVHAIVRSKTWQCTADYVGTATGTGKQPVCLKR
jgi:hypothetical protein